jgi:membrane-associated protease RseP (regulator of RpoE activity)
MSTLCVALQDGFEGDEVVVKVNGKEVFKQDSVKTKRQIGKAASFEVKVADGPAQVEVSLPLKDLLETIALKVSGETYLGVSVSENNKIKHKVSSEPFHYA